MKTNPMITKAVTNLQLREEDIRKNFELYPELNEKLECTVEEFVDALSYEDELTAMQFINRYLNEAVAIATLKSQNSNQLMPEGSIKDSFTEFMSEMIKFIDLSAKLSATLTSTMYCVDEYLRTILGSDDAVKYAVLSSSEEFIAQETRYNETFSSYLNALSAAHSTPTETTEDSEDAFHTTLSQDLNELIAEAENLNDEVETLLANQNQ